MWCKYLKNLIIPFALFFVLGTHLCVAVSSIDNDLAEIKIDDAVGDDALVEPLTPRTKAGMRAVECYDKLQKSHPDYMARCKEEGGTREGAFEYAYEETKIEILIIAAWNVLTGVEPSAYESKIAKEFGAKWVIIKIVDKIVCKGVPVVAMGMKIFWDAAKHEVLPMVKKAGLEPWKSKYWFRSSQHTFKGQTNKVYKRDDLIDLKRVEPDSGLTNLQRMIEGKAPIGPDGNPLNLHHSLQTMDSPLVEITQFMHQKYSKIIHINPKSIPSGIDRVTFDAWRADYWMKRATELGGK